MKVTALSIAALVSSAAAFQPPMIATSKQSSSSSLSMAAEDRRSFLSSAAAACFGAAVALPGTASAGLLDEFGTDPNKIVQETKDAVVPAVKAVGKKIESDFEPNLRSNYYYPTNKKRYLPRIKKCNDAIPDAAAMIGNKDWEGIEVFATKIADDTILPMKLYTSSLLGGGTNVKVSFAKDMTDAANTFEKAQKKLVKAIAKKDQDKSSAALEEMATAMQQYRTAGRLTGPDSGGDIPSVDEIRRSACRVQGRTFEKKIKDRDSRLRESTAI